MSMILVLYMAIFAGVLGALLARRRRGVAIGLLVAGLAGIAFAWLRVSVLALPLPIFVVIVAAVQLLGAMMGDSRARLTKDEETMLAGPLSGLGRAGARRFLDQGMWMEGRAGDTLTHEGDQVQNLYWLASGEAEVVAGGRAVGRIGARQLIGEATVLSPDPATATVRLTEHSRFWCAPAKALAAYLAAQPDARHALEHGFTLSLKDKLDAMNKVPR